MPVWHFLLWVTGVSNVSGRWYGFWSGFGSDLPIFGGLALYLRHHNCHQQGCWRPGHPDEKGKVACRIHLSKD